jgi:hypothetical protein
VLANPAVGQPTWFAPLIDKILLKGIRLEKDGKKLDHMFKRDDKTLTLNRIPENIEGINPINIEVKEEGL